MLAEQVGSHKPSPNPHSQTAMAALRSEDLLQLREEFRVEVRRLQAEVESLKEKLDEKDKEKKEEKTHEFKKKRDVFTSK
jgi:uncharacterized protein YlxW (UPF0749 family)